MPRFARSILLSVAAGCAFGACQSGQSPSESQTPCPQALRRARQDPHPISTQNTDAQRYFDQGLRAHLRLQPRRRDRRLPRGGAPRPELRDLLVGRRLRVRPEHQRADGARGRARGVGGGAARRKRLAEHASPVEREYIEAIQLRYVAGRRGHAGAGGAPNRRARRGLRGGDARACAEQHPNDADAQALFAESLMDLSPWNYWQDDGSPREFTRDAAAALEAALALNPDHPGALHFMIHLYERFEPEQGRGRRGPARDAGARRRPPRAHAGAHLLPGRALQGLGRHQRGRRRVRRRLLLLVPGAAVYAALYYTHNLHFLWASADDEGQQRRGDDRGAPPRRADPRRPDRDVPVPRGLPRHALLHARRASGSGTQILGEPRRPPSSAS